MSAPAFEVVIGLEVHVQLRTRSKLFSTADVGYGDEPNHHVSPVCLALPGEIIEHGHSLESFGLDAPGIAESVDEFLRTD